MKTTVLRTWPGQFAVLADNLEVSELRSVRGVHPIVGSGQLDGWAIQYSGPELQVGDEVEPA